MPYNSSKPKFTKSGGNVMLDLVEMYGMEANQLKEVVRRNLERFEGEGFILERIWGELSRSQFALLNRG